MQMQGTNQSNVLGFKGTESRARIPPDKGKQVNYAIGRTSQTSGIKLYHIELKLFLGYLSLLFKQNGNISYCK